MSEQNNGLLALVPEGRRGEPGTPIKGEKRTVRSFTIGHIPTESHIDASDVQGVRAFGSENLEQAVVTVINNKLTVMRRSLDVTREDRRVRALHGIILDADGSSELTNLFTEFNVSEQTVDFAFGTASTEIRQRCLTVRRTIDDAVGNTALITEVRVLCGSNWFDALIDHDNVKKAYENWTAAADRLGGDPRRGFTFGGLVFEEYRATVSGNAFLNVDQARAVPMGAGLYAEYFAPADYLETANTIGLPMYSKTANTKFDKGVDMEAQTNPLPIAFLPKSLIKLTKS